MRTVLVNPRHTARKSTQTRTKPRAAIVVLRNGSPTLPALANPSPMMPNPRRRRRRATGAKRIIVMGNPRRRRRRNPAPLIMPNPRRRRRRNPGFSLMGGLKTGAMAMAAGVGSYAANKFLIANIGHNDAEHWNSPSNRNGVLIRTAIRFGVAALASFFMPGTIGAAIGGAFCYPAAFELENWYRYRNAGVGAGAVDQATPLDPYRTPAALPAATGADFEADLNDALNEYGYR